MLSATTRMRSDVTAWAPSRTLGVRRVALLALVALATGAGCARAPAPRHLLIVTVDTLRADRLGAYGNRLGLTPNLDRLAAGALRFSTAYAAAPFTLASVAALMTGRYPEELGVLSNPVAVPETFPTLATRLRRHGWRTAAVVSNFILRETCGLGEGFDRYDASFPEVEAHRPVPERTAAQTTEAALRALEFLRTSRMSSTFLWVHYQDPHGPYTPPPGLRERFLEAERAAPDGRTLLPALDDERGIGGIPHYQFEEGQHEAAWYRAGYDGEVRHVDEQIGRLLAAYAARVPAEEAIVVFAADHGEGLGEGDYWFAHGERLTDALVRVPLLLRAPRRLPGSRADVVSLIDLVPTLLHALGVRDADPLAGRDLLAPEPERGPGTAYFATLQESTRPRFGLAWGGRKYVVSMQEDGPREELFTLDDEQPSGPGPLAAMRRELGALRARLPAGAVHAQVLSARDQERLRALGYVSGP